MTDQTFAICSVCGGVHEVVVVFGIPLLACAAVRPNALVIAIPIVVNHDPGDEDPAR